MHEAFWVKGRHLFENALPVVGKFYRRRQKIHLFTRTKYFAMN